MHVSQLSAPIRTELWSRRITDFVGLAIVTGVLMEFSSDILGVHDSLSIVILTLAGMSHPLLRLLQDRRSEREPSARHGSEIAAIVAVAPWILLGWLHTAYPSWSVWQSLEVSTTMRYAGCLLGLGVIVARPLLERESIDSDALSWAPPVTLPSLLLFASLLLVSGSVVAVGLTLYWLGAAGIQRVVAPLRTADGLNYELQSIQGAPN